MRQLATIQTIAEVQPIDGADSIEKVRVNDWWCVAKKGEFKEGDLCVYFEIDSLLPKDNPAFAFLEKGTKTKRMTVDGVEYEGYRLKTVRLRGQISQGLALPVETFRDVGFFKATTRMVGEDVTPSLGVVKYEPPIPAQLVGKMKGNFPAFIPKTDEERVQNLGDLLAEHEGTLMYLTEKIDGTSATFYKKDGVFGVCSRNIDMYETEDNTHWKVARALGMEELLPDNTAIQGEIYGDSIQKNPLKVQGHHFAAYNIYDIEKGEYYSFVDFEQFCSEKGIETVPILGASVVLPGTVEAILVDADGPSVLCGEAMREGVVWRPMVEARVRMRGQDGQRFSFKAISNEYLLNGGV